jgi:hypothetical protein
MTFLAPQAVSMRAEQIAALRSFIFIDDPFLQVFGVD